MILSNSIPNMAYYRARISPNREAIYDYDTDTRYTWKDLEERSEKLAWFLTNIIGLKKGDRLGFISRTNISMFDAFYASCKTGIILTTYNGMLKESELVGLLENEEPRAIFFTDCYRPKISYLKNNVSGECEYICYEAVYGPENSYCYSDVLKTEVTAKLPRPFIDPEDPQMLVHSGGTTGVPKAAILSFRCIFMNSVSEILTWQLSGRDSAYIAMPLFHTGGWNLLALPMLMTGGRLILSSVFEPQKMLEISKKEKPTIFMGVEAMLKAIAMTPEFATTDLSSYHWMINGGAPVTKETLKPYWDRGIRVFNGYGMTETGPNNLTPNVDLMTLEENCKKVNTVGKPFFFNEVRIVDANGNEVAQGERGELLWKGELSFSGYWNNPEATAAVIDDGWIHSGDVGYRDEDGDIYICDRLKNMYISGGENIFPAEVEAMVITHPEVLECCIIGVPDNTWGEVGKALVVRTLGSNLSEGELRGYLNKNISSIKRPKYIQMVDSIPKNAVGKRDMTYIRKTFGGKQQ